MKRTITILSLLLVVSVMLAQATPPPAGDGPGFSNERIDGFIGTKTFINSEGHMSVRICATSPGAPSLDWMVDEETKFKQRWLNGWLTWQVGPEGFASPADERRRLLYFNTDPSSPKYGKGHIGERPNNDAKSTLGLRTLGINDYDYSGELDSMNSTAAMSGYDASKARQLRVTNGELKLSDLDGGMMKTVIALDDVRYAKLMDLLNE